MIAILGSVDGTKIIITRFCFGCPELPPMTPKTSRFEEMQAAKRLTELRPLVASYVALIAGATRFESSSASSLACPNCAHDLYRNAHDLYPTVPLSMLEEETP